MDCKDEQLENKIKEANNELKYFDIELIKKLAIHRYKDIKLKNFRLLNNSLIEKRIKDNIIKSECIAFEKENLPLLKSRFQHSIQQYREKPIVNRKPPLSEQFNAENLLKVAEQFTNANGKRRKQFLPSQILNVDENKEIYRKVVQDKRQQSSLSNSSEIKCRAALTPIHTVDKGNGNIQIKYYTQNSIFMRFRKLTIGKGDGNDLNIMSYGNCKFISSNHAIIFYDEIAENFELLNYSEYGIKINNFTMRKGLPNLSIDDVDIKLYQGHCRCRKENLFSHLRNNFTDDSFLLGHGYVLTFGCVEFVFSIVKSE